MEGRTHVINNSVSGGYDSCYDCIEDRQNTTDVF